MWHRRLGPPTFDILKRGGRRGKQSHDARRGRRDVEARPRRRHPLAALDTPLNGWGTSSGLGTPVTPVGRSPACFGARHGPSTTAEVVPAFSATYARSRFAGARSWSYVLLWLDVFQAR